MDVRLILLPPWARGDLFADREALAAQKRLVGQIATRYRGNPDVQGFDFGNELNVVVEFVRTKATVPGMEAVDGRDLPRVQGGLRPRTS